jgi:hypothetical protein
MLPHCSPCFNQCPCPCFPLSLSMLHAVPVHALTLPRSMFPHFNCPCFHTVPVHSSTLSLSMFPHFNCPCFHTVPVHASTLSLSMFPCFPVRAPTLSLFILPFSLIPHCSLYVFTLSYPSLCWRMLYNRVHLFCIIFKNTFLALISNEKNTPRTILKNVF